MGFKVGPKGHQKKKKNKVGAPGKNGAVGWGGRCGVA